MAGFDSIKSIVDAENESGSFTISSFRKVATGISTPTNVWYDMSILPGNPPPLYYASTPTESARLTYSGQKGIFHGPNVSPQYKYLREFCILNSSANPLPANYILMDYLLYYPFIDEGTTDVQVMDNTTSLSRYTDGVGVRMMAISVAARTGGQTFQVTYTNSDGVSGRTSQIMTQGTAVQNGSIVTSGSLVANDGPFVSLQQGDSGVRSIDSVQMISGTDVGLFTLILVKPLATVVLYEQTAPAEKDLFRDQLDLPRIYDDAYLSLICSAGGSYNNTSTVGYLKTVFK